MQCYTTSGQVSAQFCVASVVATKQMTLSKTVSSDTCGTPESPRAEQPGPSRVIWTCRCVADGAGLVNDLDVLTALRQCYTVPSSQGRKIVYIVKHCAVAKGVNVADTTSALRTTHTYERPVPDDRPALACTEMKIAVAESACTQADAKYRENIRAGASRPRPPSRGQNLAVLKAIGAHRARDKLSCLCLHAA